MWLPHVARRRLLEIGVLVGCVCSAPTAQEPQAVEPTQHPLLWRIEVEPPCYLFGTIHLPDARVTTLHPAVDRAMDEVEAFYAELPLDQAFGPGMLRRLALPDRATLDQVLPQDLYDRVEAAFAESGIPFAMMRRLKIWTVAVQLQLLDHMQQFTSGKALDQVLYDRARDDLLEVGGIEDVEEQLGVFDGLDRAQQVDMLRQALRERDDARRQERDPLEELVQLYLEGDVEKLAAHGESGISDEMGDEVAERLIHARNRRMAARIEARLRGDERKATFFAVGAAHFGGPTGILTLLAAKGYRVTRLPESAARLEAEIRGLEKELERLRRRLGELRRAG